MNLARQRNQPSQSPPDISGSDHIYLHFKTYFCYPKERPRQESNLRRTV